jgi:fimbrial isopeptide formation D2 family protein/uncharacterized repeat protein (TIGR01451 family)
MNIRNLSKRLLTAKLARLKNARKANIQVERLEERENPAPIPAVQGLPATGSLMPFIGESTSFGFTFVNTAPASAANTGYSPYFDLALDTTGDTSFTPDSANDGFNAALGPVVTAAGLQLTPVGTAIVAGGTYNNPFTGQNNLPAPAGIGNGDTVYIYRLPFGSFTGGQSTAVNVTLPISTFANNQQPLGVAVVPGFRDGNSATGGVPPIVGTTQTTNATPVLVKLTKVYLGPEDETATGPNYARRYQINVDIANGQPLSNLTIQDVLTTSMQITGINATRMSAIVQGNSVFTTANVGGTANTSTPGGNLTYNFGNVTGIVGNDATFEFEYYIPRDRSGGAGAVLPQGTTAGSGTDSVRDTNRSQITPPTTWNPLDPVETRNKPVTTPLLAAVPPATIPGTPAPAQPTDRSAETLQEHALAVQKSVTPVTTAGTPRSSVVPGTNSTGTPFTLLRYVINFQASDYYALQNITLQDYLSDGQRLYLGTVGGASAEPTLQINNGWLPGNANNRFSDTTGLPFTTANTIQYQRQFSLGNALSDPTTFAGGAPTGTPYNVLAASPLTDPNDPTSGRTFLQFNISQELAARRPAGNGRLVGGEIPLNGGNPQNNAFGSQLFGAATGQIVFYAEVRDRFSDWFPSGLPLVNQGDVLNNQVPLIQGDEINPNQITAANPTIIGTATDDTSASVSIGYGLQQKTIYAINGTTVPPAGFGTVPNFQSGDRITYKLTYTLPITSFENLVISDLPPLPVVQVTPVAPGAYTFSRGVPTYASYEVSLAPDETFFSTFPARPDPSITFDAAANSVSFGFGTFEDLTQRRSTTISLLVTLPINLLPFVSDLFLTNQLRVSEGSTNAGAVTVEDIRRFDLVVPQLQIQKGVVGDSRRNGLTLGGVGFNAPGGATTFTVGGNAPSATNSVNNTTQAGAIGASNATGGNSLDAADSVRMAIVAQNVGRGDAYDVIIQDTLPLGYTLPTTAAGFATGVNLAVRRGDGTLLSSGLLVDAFAKVSSIANLSNFSGGNLTGAPTTLDGVPLYAGDFVLVRFQTNAAENGLYQVISDGNWTRVAASTALNYRVVVLGGITTTTRNSYFTGNGAGGWTNSGTVGSLPEYYLTFDPATRIFQIALNDTYSAGNTTAGTPDSRNGGLSRGAFGDTSNLTAVTNGSNTIIITYDLTLTAPIAANSVQFNQLLRNTARITNLATTEGGPDLTNSVITSGGSEPNDSADVRVRNPSITKTVIDTSVTGTNNDQLTQATIGEIVTYRVVITVPEGSAGNFSVRDTLQPGLAFQSVTSVTLTSPALTSTLTPGTGPSPILTGGTPANVVVAANGDVVTFNFGTLTNTDTTNGNTETITIVYTAVVTNVATNTNNTQINNTAAVLFNNGPSIFATAPITVVEPRVDTAKTFTLLRPDNSVPTQPQAGDSITYTVTLTSATGRPTAFDVTLSDLLPTNDVDFGATPTITYVSGPGAYTAANFQIVTGPGGTLTLQTVSPLASLAAGQAIVLRLSAGTFRASVNPNQLVRNDAITRWTSLQGTPGVQSQYNAVAIERTGNTTDAGGAANTYATTGRADVQVLTPAPVKSIVATSEASTTSNNVAIGEVVTYRLTLQIPRSTIPNLQLVDFLPPGLGYVANSGVVVFVQNGDAFGTITSSTISGAGLNQTDPTVTPTVSIADPTAFGGGFAFNLGNVVNGVSGPGAEFVIIEFQAVVTNINANQTGTTINNSFQAFVGGSANGSVSTVASVVVVEPTIVITKTASPGTGDAGDPFTYTITLENTGNATAFNTILNDIFPTQFGSPTIVTVTGANANQFEIVTLAGSQVLRTVNGATGSGITVATGVANRVTITVSGVLTVAVTPNQTITNTANVTYTSTPGTNGTGNVTPGAAGSSTGERTGAGGVNDYAANASANIVTGTASFNKTLFATSVPATTGSNVTLGETVTYALVITLPEGTSTGLVITDLLPAGLRYESIALQTSATGSNGLLTQNFGGTVNLPTVTGGPFGSGTDPVFTFGTITTNGDNNTSNNTFLLLVTATVLNVGGNVGLTPPGQTTLNNQATFDIPGDGIPVFTSPPVPVTIVEPNITISKNIVQTTGDAGDVLTVVLTVSNTGTSDAYDVIVRDTLGAAFNTALINTGTAGVDFPAGFTPAINSGVLTYSGGTISAGQTRTFTFTVPLASGVAPNQVVNNNADVQQATSTPGPNPDERTITAGPVSDSVTVPGAAFTKQLFDTGLAGTTGSNVTLGETVTYALRVTLPEGTTTGLALLDAIPAGLRYESISLLLTAAGSNGLLAADFGGTVSLPTVTGGPFGSGTDATFSFGTIVVSGDNITNNNSFLLLVTARVLNLAGNVGLNPPGQTVLPNTATLSITGNTQAPITTPPVNVTVVEPRLTITKDILQTTGDAGDVLTITLTVQNTGTSAAYDAVVRDTMATTLFNLASLNFGSSGVQYPAGYTPTVNTTTGELLYSGGTILAGATQTFTFTVPLAIGVTPTQVIVNTSDVPSASSTPGANPDERTITAGPATDTITVPNGTLLKSVSGTSLAGTAGASVAIGEVITYSLAVTLPEGTTSPLVLRDTLPAGLVYVAGSVVVDTTGFGGSISGAPTVNAVVNGDGTTSLTITFSGTIITNGDNVTTNNTFAVRYTARVQNVVGNVGFSPNQTALTNSANMTPGTAPPVPGGTTTSTVVEPQLAVVKSVTTADTSIDGGTQITYSLVISHSANSLAPAYNITLADALASIGMTLTSLTVGTNPGNISVVFGGTGNPSSYALVSSNSSTASALGLIFNELRPGDTITITYTATLNGSNSSGVIPATGSTVTNTATVNYVTAPTNGRSEPELSSSANVTVNTYSLSGQVFYDANNDGLRNNGEALITQSTTLILTGVDHLGTTISAQTVTTTNGNYSFTGLRPGNYTVTEFNQPTGFLDGRDTIGTPYPGTGTLASDPRNLRDADRIIANIPLNAAQNGIANAGINYNFGELLPASLGNFVWLDNNGNGIFDSGEPGIEGVRVVLTGTDDTGATVTPLTLTTTSTGAYNFTNLRPGTYTVTFGNTATVGATTTTYTRTFQNSTVPGATSANDSDGNRNTGATNAVTLVPGQNNPDIDQGLFIPVSVGDRVWYDLNADAVQDPNEPGIPGVTVILDYAGPDGVFGNADDVTAASTTLTGTNGIYNFTNLAPGVYRARVDTASLPGGFNVATTPTSQTTALIPSGSSDLNRDFGFRGQGTLGDRVWLDSNADGSQGTTALEPGLPGVAVVLTWLGRDGVAGGNDDVVVGTTTTDGVGAYLFSNLPGGNFRADVVAATLPGNLTATFDLTAPANGSAIRNLGILPSDRDARDVDFGYVGNSSIGDLVWFDVNGDGIRQTGTVTEPTIPGAVVTLVWGGADGNLATTADNVSYTTTTDANGGYLFPGLPVVGSGSPYRVTVTPPAQYTNQTFDADGLGTPNQSSLTLPVNTANLLQDFGYRGLNTTGLGNFVWEDLNGNGRQDSGEPGIDGVTVQLIDGSGTVIAQTITAGGGLYSFPNLIPGTYRVGFGNFTSTTTYARTLQNSPVANNTNNSDADRTTGLTGNTTLTAGTFDSTVDAGLYVPASVGDTVWYDINGNGTQQTGEPGIPNVRVFLDWAGPDGVFGNADDVPASQSMTTTSTGLYLFSNLLPGTYRSRVDATTLPNGLTNQTFDLDGLASANQADYTLVSRQNRLDADFGYRGLGSLGDRVWLDSNANGQQDAVALEPGLPGVGINLVWAGYDNNFGTADDVIVGTTTTDGVGAYLFSNLPGGNFRADINPATLPGNVTATFDLTAPANGSAVRNLGILANNRDVRDVDFGYVGNSSVGDLVWYDVDASGTQNNQEPGIAGAVVTLVWGGPDNNLATTADNVSYTTTTDANGKYLFPGLPVFGANSPYSVSVVAPAGYTTQTFDSDGLTTLNQSKLSLPANTSNLLQDFGYRGNTATGLGDFVWEDLNGNGRQDSGEPGVAGAIVQLLDSQNRILAVTGVTSTGSYNFKGLVESAVYGDYRVRVIAPTGYVFTYQSLTNTGTNNTNDSDVDRTTGTTNPVTLPVNTFNPNVDAGLYRPVTIGDRVWYDANQDGLQDANEPGLVGATVTILYNGPDGVSGTTDDKTFTQVTGTNGIWSLANQPPGNYSVTVDPLTATGNPQITLPTTPSKLTSNPVSGQTISNLDFGFVGGPGSLGDRVWLDLNKNGVQDASEPGLPGLPVTLTWLGQDGILGNSDDYTYPVATTGANGVYAFGNLPLGMFAVTLGTGNTNLLATFDLDSGITNPDNTSKVTLTTTTPTWLDVDFGVVGQAAVGDRVWVDQNRDGIQQATEPGIPKVVVVLNGAGADGVLNTTDDLTLTATTGANGIYNFTGLPIFGADGTDPYVVRVLSLPITGIVPVYDLDGITSSEVANFVLANQQQRTDVDFGYDGTASLAGNVYLDRNNNGTIDSGEPPIPGTIVTLTGFDILGNPVLDPITGKAYSTTTDSLGAYQFTTLLPGTYAVLETQPTLYNDGLDTPGNLGGNAGNDVISGVVLGPNAQGINYNFGELGTSVSGVVFRDDNRNGTQNAGEPPLVGVVVSLVNPVTGATLATTTTDASGAYSFNDLPSGNYRIIETQPAGYGNSPQTPATVRDVVVPLTGLTGQNFGEILGSLAGQVFVDANNNGFFDNGETPLANISVVLTGTDVNGPVSKTVFTNAQGSYLFDQLFSTTGTGYSIQEGVTPPYTDGKANAVGSTGGTAANPNLFSGIVLNPGDQGKPYNFGEVLPPNVTFLSGTVFRDDNRSTGIDTGEPAIAGVTVMLRGAGADGFFGTADDLLATTTTDGNGNYLFPNLVVGQKYIITETQPLAYASTTPNQISIGNLPAGGLTGQNFGEVLGSLAGTVYFDANRDGVQNSSEPGIAGTKLTLTGAGINGNAVSATVTTNLTGGYLFANLPAAGPNGYTVTETQPTGYTQGVNTAGTSAGVVGPTTDTINRVILPAGFDALSYNFGERGSPVSGLVFYDRDRDGTQQTGEPPIPGTTIQLVDVRGNVVASTTTQPDGSYLFPNVAPGSYTIVEIQPAGYGDSTPNTRQITVVGTPIRNQNFGDTLSTLAGSVYVDPNNDGIRQPGELGLGGVPVVLDNAGADGVFGTPDDILGQRITTTEGNGNFLFTDLPNAIYRLREPVQPAPFLSGINTPGSAGGVINPPLTDTIDIVPVGAGVDLTAYNFGELPPVGPPGTTFLAGTVYLDTNGNGTQTSGEQGIPGTVVTLVNPTTGATITSATTDASGNFTFTGLTPGQPYRIVETQPIPFATGPENATNIINVASLPANGLTGQNFGETPGTISGLVYFDVNNNGTYNAGTDTVLPGVVIRLLDGLGNTVGTATTLFDGSYSFTNLPAGTYRIIETQPAGFNQGTNTPGTAGSTVTGDTIGNVVLPAGGSSVNNLFGEVGANITGTVWRDDNRDGVINPGEPLLPGTLITLIDSNGNVVGTTTTDASGNYSFTNLPAGTYQILESQPAGYGNSPATPAVVRTVVLTPAGATGQNFGETLGRVAGVVYVDYDLNGALTTSGTRPDAGLAGIVVTLTGTDQFGNAVNRTTTTAADGSYSFEQLFPGAYRLTETQPNAPVTINDGGYFDGLDTIGSLGGSNNIKNQIAVSLANDAGGNSFSGVSYNFGEVPPADPFGFVFYDVNNNGIFDAGEPGIAGVVVTLGGLVTDVALGQRPVTAADVPGGLTRTTDANGRYEFVPILPGLYNLTETQPTAYLDGREQNGDTLTPPVTNITNDFFGDILTAPFQIRGPFNFGELLPASIAGTVYEDVNGNGVLNNGDTLLAGVVVTLTGTDDLGQTVSRTLTTGADGTYNFTTLRPGTYTLTETQPAGFQQATNTVGSTGGSNSSTDTISTITIVPGANGVGYNFGEIRPASISGNVYVDLNTNGIKDGNDTGIANVTVTLTGTDGQGNSVRSVATTDRLGNFSFTNLRPGTYTLTETQPAYRQGTNAVGSTGGTLAADLVSGITLRSGSVGTNYLFGEILPTIRPNPLPPLPELPRPVVPPTVLPPAVDDPSKREFLGSTTGGTTTTVPPTTPPVTGRLTPNYAAIGSISTTRLTPEYVATAEGSGANNGLVRVFDMTSGNERFRFNPFPGNTGGTRVTTADVTGDGIPDIITASGPGGLPRVIIYDGNSGAEIQNFLVFDGLFNGGLFVAAGDFDLDGRADVVVSADDKGGPRVTVYSAGDPNRKMVDFFGIPDANFRGGARVAVGDISGDGRADLVVGAGFGGGPRITAWNGQSIASGLPVAIADFFAFESALRNGTYVAVGDVDGDGFGDIIAGAGPGGGPRVTGFSGQSLIATGNLTQVTNFFAGDSSLRGGVRVAAKDFEGDKLAEIVTGSAETELPVIRFYNPRSGTLLDEFYAEYAELTPGVFVG